MFNKLLGFVLALALALGACSAVFAEESYGWSDVEKGNALYQVRTFNGDSLGLSAEFSKIMQPLEKEIASKNKFTEDEMDKLDDDLYYLKTVYMLVCDYMGEIEEKLDTYENSYSEVDFLKDMKDAATELQKSHPIDMFNMAINWINAYAGNSKLDASNILKRTIGLLNGIYDFSTNYTRNSTRYDPRRDAD